MLELTPNIQARNEKKEKSGSKVNQVKKVLFA
jgi:hypothetical protein